MACKVRNTRLSAIYDVIIALTREDPNVSTLKDVQNWFAQNQPGVQPHEVIDSLVATSPDKISEARRNLIKRRTLIKRQAKQVQALDDLMNGIVKHPNKRTKVAPANELKSLDNLVKDLFKMIQLDNVLSNEDWLRIKNRLEEIQVFHQQVYTKTGETRTEAVKRIVRAVQDIKTNFKVNSLNSRLSELQGKIDNLASDDIDVDSLVHPDSHVIFKPLDKRILEKEAELRDLKMQFDDRLHKVRTREIAAREGLLGFTGKNAIRTREVWEVFKREFWEAPRSLAFMADASAWMVQLAPVVMMETTNVNLRQLVKGNFTEAFQSQRNLARIFNESTYQIFKNELTNIQSSKKSKGHLAIKLLKDIKTDPLYPLMRKSGLKISESKSLSNSEEVYTSDVLNNVPVVGLVKDISEDTMVSTLNMYRVQLFKQFWNMNPGLSTEEYTKASEFINELTGTSSVKNTGILNYFMSAPRLLISRLRLAFVRPLQIATRLNINKSLREKGVRYQTAADQYMAQKLFQMWKGYAAWFTLLALIPGIEFGEDEDESDFLRIRVGNTSMDFTGGLGAMYRMIAKVMLLTNGPDDDASYLAKKRADYYRGATGEGVKDVLITTLMKYRLHPTVGALASVYEGEDFFGEPFHEIFGPGHVGSRMEGLLRASMPISVETAMDQFFFTPNTNPVEDALLSSIQFFGVNTFEYGDGSQDLRTQDYFNAIEYKPSTDYPDELSSGKIVLDPVAKSLRQAYKTKYGNLMRDVILESGADPERLSKSRFKGKLKAANNKMKREFLDEYANEISRLTPKK